MVSKNLRYISRSSFKPLYCRSFILQKYNLKKEKLPPEPVRGESILPRYHPDLRKNTHLSDPVSGIRRPAFAGCSEVAVSQAERGHSPRPSPFGSAGWKTRFLIAFTILRIYYATFPALCQQKTGQKAGFLREKKREIREGKMMDLCG